MLDLSQLLKEVGIKNNRPRIKENAGHVTFRPFNKLIKSLKLLFQDHQDQIDAGNLAKLYNANITQSGTDIPTEVILENNLGLGEISWARSTAGTYQATLTDLFIDPSKVQIFIGNNMTSDAINNAGAVYNVRKIDADTFELSVGIPTTFALSDGELKNTAIEIRVYP